MLLLQDYTTCYPNTITDRPIVSRYRLRHRFFQITRPTDRTFPLRTVSSFKWSRIICFLAYAQASKFELPSTSSSPSRPLNFRAPLTDTFFDYIFCFSASSIYQPQSKQSHNMTLEVPSSSSLSRQHPKSEGITAIVDCQSVSLSEPGGSRISSTSFWFTSPYLLSSTTRSTRVIFSRRYHHYLSVLIHSHRSFRPLLLIASHYGLLPLQDSTRCPNTTIDTSFTTPVAVFVIVATIWYHIASNWIMIELSHYRLFLPWRQLFFTAPVRFRSVELIQYRHRHHDRPRQSMTAKQYYPQCRLLKQLRLYLKFGWIFFSRSIPSSLTRTHDRSERH